MKTPAYRCINLDWLEVYCLEDDRTYPHDEDYFRRCGYEVRSRGYGTRVYTQMFTILNDHLEPLIEVRRVPVGAFKSGEKCILEPYSCHLRLCNSTCYRDDAARFLDDFLKQHGFHFQRISRVDICLDFEYFDSGDDPQKFVKRYLNRTYMKINQANISAHGKDELDGITFNSLSWGSPVSAISTKLYNKTLEIKQVKDKPYIRQAWFLSHLVDNPVTLMRCPTPTTAYEPVIWRLEFSIRSSLKGWLTMKTEHGEHNKFQSVRNTLDIFYTRESMLNLFASIQYHYFYFVYYEEGKRKYACKQKQLFDFSSQQTQFYRVDKVATAKPLDKSVPALIKRLQHYRLTHPQPALVQACDTLLADLQDTELRSTLSDPFNRTELQLLQQLIALRMKENTRRPLEEDKERLESMLGLLDDLF